MKNLRKWLSLSKKMKREMQMRKMRKPRLKRIKTGSKSVKKARKIAKMEIKTKMRDRKTRCQKKRPRARYQMSKIYEFEKNMRLEDESRIFYTLKNNL